MGAMERMGKCRSFNRLRARKKLHNPLLRIKRMRLLQKMVFRKRQIVRIVGGTKEGGSLFQLLRNLYPKLPTRQVLPMDRKNKLRRRQNLIQRTIKQPQTRNNTLHLGIQMKL